MVLIRNSTPHSSCTYVKLQSSRAHHRTISPWQFLFFPHPRSVMVACLDEKFSIVLVQGPYVLYASCFVNYNVIHLPPSCHHNHVANVSSTHLIPLPDQSFWTVNPINVVPEPTELANKLNTSLLDPNTYTFVHPKFVYLSLSGLRSILLIVIVIFDTLFCLINHRYQEFRLTLLAGRSHKVQPAST